MEKWSRQILRHLSEYTDRTIAPNQFLDDFYENNEHEISVDLKPIVYKTFFHLVRMEPVLAIIVQGYCKYRGRRKDEDVQDLTVMTYLLVFKLTPESQSHVQEALFSLHPLKAYHLLNYLTERDSAVLLSRAASQVFDVQFVREKIMQPFLAGSSSLKELRDDIKQWFLEEKRKRVAPLTKPVSPKMMRESKKKPVTPANTELSLAVTIPLAPPPSTYEEPIERAALKVKADEHRQVAQQLYETANRQAFNCATAAKSAHYEQIVAKIQEERAQLLKPVPRSTKPPRFKAVAPEVKVNTATVLREAARLTREEEEKIKRVEDMSSGGGNCFYLEQVALEMQKRRQEERLAEIQTNHLKGLLTHEEAALAKQTVLERNKEKTAQVKREKEAMDRQLQAWQEEEEWKLKNLVLKCQESLLKAREAQDLLQQRKAKAVQEMNEESQERMQRAWKEQQEELNRKMNLIAEIRALHVLHTLRDKQGDQPQKPAGLGQLCGMSESELKERLTNMQKELQEELEERQKFIREQRERQQKLLSKTQEFIKIHRLARKQLEMKPDLKNIEIPQTQEIENLRKALEAKREMRRNLACLM